MFNLFSKKKPETVKEVLDYAEGLEKKITEISAELENLKKKSVFSVQKLGIVRYNPFSGVGSDQSFSIALLDGNDNGVVISSIFSQEGNRVYSKPIEKGFSKYSLSDEEKEAMKKAVGSK